MSESPPIPPRVREIMIGFLEAETVTEQTTYLERACGGDHALKREVKALLAESNQLNGFLEDPAAAEADNWRERESSEHIGPYKLLQEIGEGGCGVVYMAEQEVPVRRRVALKIIKLGMDTKSVIARFESERQALAMMDHPNIAKVLDAGATENGRPYFVMELVRGVRITDYCDQHKLSTEERLRLFVLVAQAIQHAHQKGIIHRDIKPSNILVTLHDGLPVPKIIDFGIAKAVDQRLTDKTLFTEFQSFIGTPAYMSPEQAEMTGLDIDTRSDIYSLGVLLYELLVGSTPFDPNTLRDAGLDECRRTIREEEPAKPSMRLSTLLDADCETIAAQRVTQGALLVSRLRGELDWIVMKCLDKDRQRRYATASALAADVQHYLDGDVVTARPPSRVYRLQKAWRRHRLVFTAASAVAAALILGIGASSWLAVRAMEAEQESTKLRMEAETNLTQSIQSAARARLNEYVADMNVANYSLQNGNLGRTRQLLEKHLPVAGRPDLRGFEWHYLAHESEGDAHLAYPLQGASVYELAFSRDGVLLAVGMERETKVWDVRSQSLVITLTTSGRSLGFAADGASLITGDREATKVWNTTTWTEQLSLPSGAEEMALSPDGRLLAISNGRSRGRSESSVSVWTTSDWKRVCSIDNVSGHLAFSPSGQQLVIASSRGISLWGTFSGELVRTLEYSDDLRPSWVAYSPDGRTIVAPRNDQNSMGAFLLNLWEASTGREIGVVPDDPRRVYHRSTISAASWTPDSGLLLTGGWDHSIQLWDAQSRKHVGSLRGHRNEVWAMAMSPSGETVASGGKDGGLLLWPVQVSKKRDTVEESWRPLAFDETGSKLAAINRENTLAFFDPTTLAIRERIELGGHERWQPPIGLSADLGTLVRRLSESRVEVRDLIASKTRVIDLAKRRLVRLTLSPKGRYLIAEAYHDSELAWWDLETDTLLREIPGERAVFSSDGSTLVTQPGRGEREVRIWNVNSGELRSMISLGEPGYGFVAALSSDGAFLAVTTGINDATHAIRLWDANGELLGMCLGHKQGIRAVSFSPDGRTLASASDDGSLKLWNVTSRQELLSIQRLGSSISSLVFSRDGQWLAAGPSVSFTSMGAGELRLFQAPQR